MTIFWCVLVVATFSLSGCAPSLVSSDPQQRLKAVGLLTNQTILAKVAVGDPDYVVRTAAVNKLTDQQLLAEVAMKSRYSDLSAAQKLTDQLLVANLLDQAEQNESVSMAAVANLHTQTLLANVVSNNPLLSVRLAAAAQLDDQTLLTDAAANNYLLAVRVAAAKKLTDQLANQLVFANIVASSHGPTNSPLFERLFCKTNPVLTLDQVAFVNSISMLVQTDKWARVVLVVAAGDMTQPAFCPRSAVARLELIVQETRLRERLPGFHFQYEAMSTSQGYSFKNYGSPLPLPSAPIATIEGSWIRIAILLGDKLDHQYTFETEFPKEASVPITAARTDYEKWIGPRCAHVDLEMILERLFSLSVFKRADFQMLSESEVPELREAAAKHLADQQVFAKQARYDRSRQVRMAALRKLTDDQHLLEQFAVGVSGTGKVYNVITGGLQSLNERTKDDVREVRLTSILKLTNRVVVAKLMTDSADPTVREYARKTLMTLKSGDVPRRLP